VFNVKFRGDDHRPTQSEHNATRKAALDAMGRELSRIAPGVDIPKRSQTLARVKGHAALSRWQPIGLGAALMPPTGATWTPGLEFVSAFQGIAAEKNKPWGILLEPCSVGSYAWCIVRGLALASVTIANTSRPNAGADIGTSGLEIAEGGTARVLWRQAGTGARPCLLDLCPSTPKWFVATTLEAIAAGDMGTVKPAGADTLIIDVKNEASETVPVSSKIGVSWDDYQGVYVISMEFC
jgi:hypothetical protein